jgi:hypothetical protein
MGLRYNPITNRFELKGATIDLSGYVTYTGANGDLDLGANNLTASGININGTLNLYDPEDSGFGYTQLYLSTYYFYNAFGDLANIVGATYSGTFGVFSGSVQARVGSATLPSFTFNNDTNTGIFSGGSDNVQVTTNGVARLGVSTTQFTGTLPFRGQNGSATAPAYSFSGDTNTGMYWISADTLGFTAGGGERARLNSTGLAIGVNSPSARLHAVSTGQQLRLGYNTTQYWTAYTGSTGITTFDAVGTNARFIFSDPVTVNSSLRVSNGDVEGVLWSGMWSDMETGLYCSDSDQTIASFDLDEGQYYYFDRSMSGSPSGISITAPVTINNFFEVYRTSQQQRIGYNGSNYYSTTVSSTGAVTFDAVGSGASFVFSDTVQASGYKSSDGSVGATGSFTTADSKTVTVKNGLITSIT